MLIALAVLAAAAPACRAKDPPEAARARANKEFLEAQVKGLQQFIGKVERGALVMSGQIAVAVGESAARDLLNGPLPQRQSLGKGIQLTLEHAEPYFRGTQAALIFKARITSDALPNEYAELEMAGGLDEMRLASGRLSARARVFHFAIVRTSVGALAQRAVESLVRANLDAIEAHIPPLEVPVRFEDELSVDRFDEGPVSADGGTLPIHATVSQVICVNTRLWILIDAKVGTWKPAAKAAS